jgi:hypothetical protein
METNLLRALVFGSLALYFALRRRERSSVTDERSELIHLRAVEMVQNATFLSLGAFGLAYLWNPELDMVYVLVALVALHFGVYPIAKLRLSRTL